MIILNKYNREIFQAMNIVSNLREWQDIRKKLNHQSIGFVPTMGNLHDGHLSLCQRAKRENEITVVSIFINHTQFNNQSDFDLYPRTMEADQALLEKQKIDYLILPSAADIYPDNYEIMVSEKNISHQLEGEYRPGHFDGMLTIVLKLLNLVQPTRSYFGEKDYQQLLLIKKMASALFLSTEIIACPTLRAIDGLALSSRNSRLSSAQREHAVHFPTLLNSELNTAEITEKLTELGFKVDYIIEKWQRRLGAVWLDDIRLIDNIPYFYDI